MEEKEFNEETKKIEAALENVRKKIDVTKSQIYQDNANKIVKDLNKDILELLIQAFFRKAAAEMGKEQYDKEYETVLCILEFVQKEFNYLPISYVYSAFLNGSLGKYEQGRLVPRTVYCWMQSVAQDYLNNCKSEKFNPMAIGFNDLKNSKSSDLPVGEALIRKIDLYTSGIIDDNAWDKIDIIEFARAIKNKTEKNFLNNLIGYEKV